MKLFEEVVTAKAKYDNLTRMLESRIEEYAFSIRPDILEKARTKPEFHLQVYFVDGGIEMRSVTDDWTDEQKNQLKSFITDLGVPCLTAVDRRGNRYMWGI